MAALVVVEGPEEGKTFPQGQAKVVMVGRDPNCTFQFLDSRLSRLHMPIRCVEGADRHTAIDFQSSNGVFVNGSRISGEVPLADGERIQIGGTALIYSIEDDLKNRSHDELVHRHRQSAVMTQLGE